MKLDRAEIIMIIAALLLIVAGVLMNINSSTEHSTRVVSLLLFGAGGLILGYTRGISRNR